MWLSKPLYELLPYYYMVAGLLALVASYFMDFWYWPSICLVLGVLYVTGGLVIWLKRRDYRRHHGRPR
jgi:ABC-type Mn2+/Zn2+ transport system permease subunit